MIDATFVDEDIFNADSTSKVAAAYDAQNPFDGD